MGLSTWERVGSRKLLDLLDTADLFSLAATVTKKKSTACTRTGAIDVILQNSQSAYELLNHRKVFCDTIAQYLKNEGVLVPQKITKAEAIQKTILHWKHQNSYITVARTFIPQLKTPDFDFAHQFHCTSSILPVQDASNTWSLGDQTSNMNGSVAVSSAGLHPTQPKNVSGPCIPAARTFIPSPITQQHKGSTSDSSRLFYCDKSTSTSPIHRPLQDTKETWNLTAQTSDMEVEQDTAQIWPVDCEKFARDFCEWFYPLLNSQNPSSGLQKQDWGPQHFLGHAALQLTYMSDRRVYNGSGNTSSRLLTLVQNDNISFQPNLTSGRVKCERSPKGLVVVTVGGVILKNKTHWGIFDQVFEIVGNTSGDNWKIRSIDLKILGGS